MVFKLQLAWKVSRPTHHGQRPKISNTTMMGVCKHAVEYGAGSASSANMDGYADEPLAPSWWHELPVGDNPECAYSLSNLLA